MWLLRSPADSYWTSFPWRPVLLSAASPHLCFIGLSEGKQGLHRHDPWGDGRPKTLTQEWPEGHVLPGLDISCWDRRHKRHGGHRTGPVNHLSPHTQTALSYADVYKQSKKNPLMCRVSYTEIIKHAITNVCVTWRESKSQYTPLRTQSWNTSYISKLHYTAKSSSFSGCIACDWWPILHLQFREAVKQSSWPLLRSA